MDIDQFRTRLNQLISQGCTELSAGYVNSDEHKSFYKGCVVGSPAEQYIKLVIEDSKGYVFANYSNFPNIEFRVAMSKNADEFSVRYIEKSKSNPQVAVIRIM